MGIAIKYEKTVSWNIISLCTNFDLFVGSKNRRALLGGLTVNLLLIIEVDPVASLLINVGINLLKVYGIYDIKKIHVT